MIRLRVWANDQPMGWFGHEAGQYFFQYDESWLSAEHACVLAPQFVLRAEPYSGEPIKTFSRTCCQRGLLWRRSWARCTCAMPAHLKSSAS